MIEYVKKVFQKYATFNGRANRPEFWWFFLLLILASIVFNILQLYMGMGAVLLSAAWSLGTLIPYIAVGVRRMHDVGKSGWYLLIPIYNLVLLCTEGQPGANEYGPNPNGGDDGTFDFENNRLSA